MTDSDPRTAVSLELVRRAQAGEHAALERLFARYYDRVRRIVRIRLGAGLRRMLDAEDILQETFVEAVRSFDAFEVREEARLIDWLGRIAENRIRAAARQARAAKRDRAREVTLERLRSSVASGALVPEPAASITLPGDRAAAAEERERLEECIAALKEEYREVILRRDYEGGSWATVASLMGSPGPNAARMLHARALIELAALVRRRAGE
ncbi:MAG: sigma-70 family RNA polymerase sigma factor [Planctomycetota bacterium]